MSQQVSRICLSQWRHIQTSTESVVTTSTKLKEYTKERINKSTPPHIIEGISE